MQALFTSLSLRNLLLPLAFLFGFSAVGQDLIIVTEVCTPASQVRMTGPWWGWNPHGGPVAVDNGNGTWTFTLSPAPTADMEYLLVVDSVQENLIAEMQNGGTCAPITDFATYANREWLTTDPLTVNNTYGQCGACAPPTDLVIVTEVCTPATEVRLTGPWWGWDPFGGPVAVDNGNGTWTFTLSPAPTADMEYLLVVDSVQENLIAEMQNGGTCAPITDFATYANRQWLTTDPLTVNNTFGQCGACAPPADLVIVTEVCVPATEVRLTGPWWGWDPFGGPIAVDNGNGTWTFTFSPAPTANMEYLLVVDSVQENLIAEMQNGGTCAPITDFATYANRQWLTTDSTWISNTYGQCGACAPPADLVIVTEVCVPATEVRLTGPWWGWDPFGGPVAVDNGNGTWTFTFSPAPTANMEYLLVVDSVQENLIVEMQNGGTCAPITDFATYANRQWLTTDSTWISNTYGQCGACAPPGDLIIVTEVCDSASEVRLTGPWWGWDPFGGPIAVDNGNGTWTFTFSPAPTADMEYLLVVDSVQENLIAEMQNGGTCAPITDFANYANRQWLTTDSTWISNTYNYCAGCPVSDLLITVEVCDGANEVRMTGPFWNWDPFGGPIAVDNGNGTWTFTLSPAPSQDMEYLIVVDSVQENLISDMQNGGDCAPVTDYSSYANRLWTVGSGDVTGIVYDRCVPCSYPDIMITTEICDSSATQVNLTGPIWGWNPAFGPQAVDNGDGTWTFTISPAPSDTLEYLLVKDGVQEDLIAEMQNGGTCAPLTDFSTYASRIWEIGDGAITNTYGQCSACSTIGFDEYDFSNLSVYPIPAKNQIFFSNSDNLDRVTLYNVVGEVVLEESVNATTGQLDISALASGAYYLTVMKGSAQAVRPIIVQ